MSTTRILITGAPRSGTTLVDKMLWGISGLDCFSQPLPLLLTQIKTAFLKHNGAAKRLCAAPLSDLQFENAYPENDFFAFLNTLDISSGFVGDALKAMHDYSGQYFKPENPMRALEVWTGGHLAAFADHYFEVFAQKPAHEISAWAWKETGAEEFIPYFLEHGVKIMLILRDPRDIAASLYYGSADTHTGQPRPLLFMARQWRKSAAAFARYADHPDVVCVRYEDLIGDPQQHWQNWHGWIGVPGAKTEFSLHTQNGQDWHGNSSFDQFDGISGKAVGRYRDVLPADQRAFIEALTFGEMLMTGYTPKLAQEGVEAALVAGPKTDYLSRDALAHYAYDATRRDEELQRWASLNDARKNANPAAFINAAHYQNVRNAVTPS